jgi:uncharacterized lipoprotein YbaY
MRLRGHVRLPEGASAPPDSRLVLRVEDIAEADAPAHLVARHEMPAPAAGPYPFDFEFSPPAGRPHCILTARIAAGDPSRVSPGDYLTTRAYRIETAQAEQALELELTRAA